MTSKKLWSGMLLVVLAALASSGATAAGLGDAQTGAAFYQYATGMQLLPQVEYDEAILTVTGQGRLYRHTFAAGVAPTLDLFDQNGELIADGTYTWQLELLPTPEAAVELVKAHKKGELGASAYEPQSGSFTVEGGYLVDSSLIEPQAGRKAIAPVDSIGAFPAFASKGDRENTFDGDDLVYSGVVSERFEAAASAPQLTATSALTSEASAADSDAAAPTLMSAAAALAPAVGVEAVRPGRGLVKGNNGRPDGAEPRD